MLHADTETFTNMVIYYVKLYHREINVVIKQWMISFDLYTYNDRVNAFTHFTSHLIIIWYTYRRT